MATVKIGHASVDENGKATGGKAGDQTKKEVCIRDWYKNTKGWYLLRVTNADAAENIAYAMERACANDNIGYDQGQRDTLYAQAKAVGFDPGKVAAACETDCSALVRVCMAYAGIHVDSFRTANQAAALLKTGMFDKLTYPLYTDQSAYLRRGDILVTRVSGHTVVVLTGGAKAHSTARPYLHRGDGGPVVKTLQYLLIAKGYALPKYGADGDFGAETESAVKVFQKARGLEVDGVVGALTWGALLTDSVAAPTYCVIISGLTQTPAHNLTGEMQNAGYTARMEAE